MTLFKNGGVEVYRAAALASGLKLYAATGLKPNRAWTPSAMLRNASAITGNAYKRGEYEKAAADLKEIVDEMTPVAVKRGDIKP